MNVLGTRFIREQQHMKLSFRNVKQQCHQVGLGAYSSTWSRKLKIKAFAPLKQNKAG